MPTSSRCARWLVRSGLDELRARSNTLLAAAAVSASFLGAPGIQRAGVSIPLLLASVAFVVCVGLCLFLLVPTELTFAVNGPEVYETLYAHAEDPDEVHRQLAYAAHVGVWPTSTLIAPRPSRKAVEAPPFSGRVQ